ncbi:L-threonylcarbamoyladenylate synthase [soil metagenome]
MTKIGKDIALAKQLLESGQLVAIPTETVYGLAANGLNPVAVARIFEAKNRPSFNPLILHVADVAHAKALTRDFPTKAQQLADVFWPGPLTIVLPKHASVPEIATGGLDTVALRVPAHSLTLELLRSLDFPLAAPSANPSGYSSPTQALHVAEQLGERVAYILDGGPAAVGVESTIVMVKDDKVYLLRQGGISEETLQAVVGQIIVNTDAHDKPLAPGMMLNHYAPRKTVLLGNLRQLQAEHFNAKLGVLAFMNPLPEVPEDQQRILSPSGDLAEAAANVFAYLRELDKLELDFIITELVPNEGIGRAVNDRLSRASGDVG